MTGIYKITSPTGKIYIGQSKNIVKRFSNYKKLINCKRQPKLYRSFLKHGVENHIFEIIEECSVELLNERERYWQDELDVLNRGLNCILQSTSEKQRIDSQETNKKKGLKGELNPRFGITLDKHPFYGKKHSEKTLKFMSEKQKGSNNPMYGKVGLNNPNFGRKQSEEEISKKRGGKNPNAKIVIDIQTGIFYESLSEASELLKINYNTLKKYMCGTKKNKTSLMYC